MENKVPGSAINILDHISKSLKIIIWVKKFKFFVAPDPGWKKGIRDPRLKKNPDPGSAINILDHNSKSLVRNISFKNAWILCCGSGAIFFISDLLLKGEG